MKTIRTLCIMMLLALLGSCTHNGGDIGDWFGTWSIDSITSAEPTTYGGNAFMQFQGKVVRMTQTYDQQAYMDTYGNWAETQGTLAITFPDPELPPLPLPGMSTNCQFTIVQRSTAHTTLQLVAPQGTTFQYHLHKVK